MTTGAPGRGSRRSGGLRRLQTALGGRGRVLAVLLAVGLLGAGCSNPVPRGSDEDGATVAGSIHVWHDDERSVTCWVYARIYSGGISCLPDSEVGR